MLAVLFAAAGSFLLLRSAPRDAPSVSSFTEDEDVLSVSSFIDGYFSSWSAQLMDEYERCFHPTATIHWVAPDGRPFSSPLQPFILGQTEAHRRATKPMNEVPLKKTIHVNGTLAHAEVEWQLSKGSETVTGVDIFSLVRTGDGWKILSLVYASH